MEPPAPQLIVQLHALLEPYETNVYKSEVVTGTQHMVLILLVRHPPLKIYIQNNADSVLCSGKPHAQPKMTRKRPHKNNVINGVASLDLTVLVRNVWESNYLN
jgi:hypothetical protein